MSTTTAADAVTYWRGRERFLVHLIARMEAGGIAEPGAIREARIALREVRVRIVRDEKRGPSAM
jgi:hypothetical protein